MDTPLLKQLHETRTYLSTLKSDVNSKQDVLTWFQVLCGKLCDLLLKLAQNVRKCSGEPIGQSRKEALLLYLLQLNTTLSMLIKVFTTESDIGVTINESRYSILQQTVMCLTGIESMIKSNTCPEDGTAGFVKYMDLALERMMEIDVESGFELAQQRTEAARAVIEEALCHAMSIAQVALKEDCDVIKGSSKEVLNNLGYLTTELRKPAPSLSMCSLFADSACDRLCALERKVNASVLKLALKVFSECTTPLEGLHQFCLQCHQKETALGAAVAQFDLHVDRMIQVGLFAVSCSADRSRTLQMRSCLASLEALEGELVPAMTALVRDATVHNLYHADMLKHYWMRQATDLKQHIYRLIDPLAFCQVTLEVIREINSALEERFRDVALVDMNHIKPITLQTRTLYEMLLVSLADSPPENQDVVRKCLNDVICMTAEIDAAAEKLLRESQLCRENVLRVFKRCKVQESILKKLLGALGSSLEKPLERRGRHSADEEGRGRGREHEHERERTLEHIATRGRRILEERSVLYRTPARAAPDAGSDTPSSRAPRLAHLRSMQFSHSRSVLGASSCDLQISDILDNLTALSACVKG